MALRCGLAAMPRVRVDNLSGLLAYCGLVHFDAGEWCGVHLDKVRSLQC